MKIYIFFVAILLCGKIYSQSNDREALPEAHRNFKIQFFKLLEETDKKQDVFKEELQPNQRKDFLHFRVVKDNENKIISIAYYHKNLKIAPYVNNDNIWFHFIKFYYDDKNRLNKKIYYRESGEPQGQYVFEYDNNNRLIKLELQSYILSPYREKEYKAEYFVLFDYHSNCKLRMKGRFDKNSNPEEKYIYNEQDKIVRYERFYSNTRVLHYYLTFQYDGQNNVSIQTVYNIDGVMIEVPSTEEPRNYQDLIQTRYPRPGRRGPAGTTEQNNSTNQSQQ